MKAPVFFISSKLLIIRIAGICMLIFMASCNKKAEPSDISADHKFDDYLFITSYGQSNSNGGGERVVITTFNKYNALMPQSGLWIDSGQVYTPLRPLSEVDSETPVSGSVESFFSLLQNESYDIFLRRPFEVIATASGQGGRPISQLSKGSRFYNRVIDQVEKLASFSKNNDKTISVPFIYFTQGESDYEARPATAYDAYRELLLKLISDFNTDISFVTGQRNKIPFVGFQITDGIYQGTNYQQAWTVSKVQYDEGIDPLSPYVMACPSYMFRYQLVDHIMPEDRKIYGAYLGIAAKRTFVDAKKFIPMHPVKAVCNGNNIQIQFYAPVYPILIDSDIPTAANYGFRIVKNSVTNDTLEIKSVKVINDNTVSIDVSANPIGDTLYYAVDPVSAQFSGPSNKYFWFASRGNLHDSQKIVFEGATLYNYSARFWIPLTK